MFSFLCLSGGSSGSGPPRSSRKDNRGEEVLCGVIFGNFDFKRKAFGRRRPERKGKHRNCGAPPYPLGESDFHDPSCCSTATLPAKGKIFSFISSFLFLFLTLPFLSLSRSQRSVLLQLQQDHPVQLMSVHPVLRVLLQLPPFLQSLLREL